VFDVEVDPADAEAFTHERVMAILGTRNTAMASLSEANVRSLVGVWTNNSIILHRYEHRTVAADTLLFVATGGTGRALTADDWRPYLTGNVDARNIDCPHPRMLNEGPLAALGPQLDTALDGLRRAGSGV